MKWFNEDGKKTRVWEDSRLYDILYYADQCEMEKRKRRKKSEEKNASGNGVSCLALLSTRASYEYEVPHI
ncbi:hypothetical protein ccbrp13_58950 [Ktedonobacteria bacterium brp13]|nr:hypothetical protein ccbrp13_58950 [Ktedonobacteria bacterium brp13]